MYKNRPKIQLSNYMNENRRRSFIKKLGIGFASISFYLSGITSLIAGSKKRYSSEDTAKKVFADNFAETNDRIWLGEDYWPVPMEDWMVKAGRIEFIGAEKFSRVNLLTTVIKGGDGEILISCKLGLIPQRGSTSKTGSAGFSIGIKDNLDADVKSACYFGEGINAGISTEGTLFIADQKVMLPKEFDYSDFNLLLKGKTIGNSTSLNLICKSAKGHAAEVVYNIQRDINGLIALANNLQGEKNGAAFWFKNWNMSGTKLEQKPKNSFGPVLWTMYTLSKSTLNLMAQMPPLSKQDNTNVELYLKRNNLWEETTISQIDEAAYTVNFKLDKWNENQDIPYRILYKNGGPEYTYDGVIRKEPLDRPIKFGGLTCQEYSGFPYNPLINNLKKHDPDILYFSGDQLYEANGGYPIKRQPEEKAILSYLGKWYMFGWAFGNIMRDRPTICTPDDHDVFQGNLWGEGGQEISFEEWEKVRDAHGGYVQTPKMINVVADTQCGHMPVSFHPEPLKSGIKPWYTDLVYGNVSFAIISDRMFKSGPKIVRNGAGRIDHIKEPLSQNQLEDPNLEFLGGKQMQFLEHWINDWKGANMKVLLSQTLFANVGTHHGSDKMFLYGDMDSGGWPKQKRDDALRVIRKAFVFHVNGDQHLPFIVQYSLNKARDAGWTFCTPAISTGYSRWGEPDSVNTPFTDRPAHGLPNTGCYKDVFGNVNYVYAVGNPKDNYSDKNRYQQAHNKASGFGLVTIDTAERTIKMEAFRFLADKDKPTPDDQFPGWPLTISQMDNDGREVVSFLPTFKINRADQLIKIIDEENELVNVIRINGLSYEPGVYRQGTYKVIIGDGNNVKVFKNIQSTIEKSHKVIHVKV